MQDIVEVVGGDYFVFCVVVFDGDVCCGGGVVDDGFDFGWVDFCLVVDVFDVLYYVD